MMSPSCVLFAGIVLAHSANTTTPIRVVLREVGAVSASTTEVEVVAQAIAGEDGAKVVGEIVRKITAGEVTLDLASGTWILTARKKGFWGGPESLVVDGERGERLPVTLKLWPAGVVAGKVVARASDMLPPRITMVFGPSAPAGTPEGDRLPAKTSVGCPVDHDGAWSCELPSQTLDLQLRSKPYIPHYRWDVELKPNRRVELGTLALRRGASVAGWVRKENGTPAGPTCRVELKTPRHEESIKRPAQPVSVDGPPFVATVNHRGFFQIASVPPGDYAVTAEEGTSTAAAPIVQVYEDSESLPLAPIVLSEPVALHLLLDPPIDPWEKQWSVRLFRKQGRHVVPVEGASRPVEAGVFRRDGLRPGSYLVIVLAESGTRWFNETIELDRETGPVRIDLPLMKVQGTVKMGKEPLSGEVVFGGTHGSVSVKLSSDAEGHFSGLLPQDRTQTRAWDVEVTASAPRVQRTFEQVEVAAIASGEAVVNLVLPATRLKGVVVDTEGRPVRAVVDDQSIGEVTPRVQVLTEDDGRFELNGVAPGPHLLSAQGLGAGGLTSDEVGVSVQQDAEMSPVQLVVRGGVVVKGQVLSAEGVVPGARLRATPAQAPLRPVPLQRTDSEGRFELRLPPGTAEVGFSVAAPGYAFTILRAPVRPDTPRSILLDRNGGKLVLDLPTLTDTRESAPVALLVHRGYFESVAYLMEWGEIHGGGVNAAGQTVIPQLDPGLYTACLATAIDVPALLGGRFPKDRCVSDTLAPGGEMHLTIPQPPAAPKQP